MAVFVIAVVFLFALPFTSVNAETGDFEFITSNYYRFDALSSLSVDDGIICALETASDGVYLRVVGKKDDYVLLGNANVEDVNSYKATVVNGEVYLYLGEEYIYKYDLDKQELSLSYIPSKYVLTEEYVYDFTSMCADCEKGVVFVNYQNFVLGYDLEKLKESEDVKTARVFSADVRNEYDNMIAESTEKGVKLYFYNSADGYTYAVEKEDYAQDNSLLKITARSQSLYFASSPASFALLEQGAELAENGVIVKTFDGKELTIPFGQNSDDKLGSVDALFADGSLLYVLDNARNAIKVFSIGQDEMILVEMYGSYGYGSGDNEKGLTRFVAPDKLSAVNDGVCVYDKGNGKIVTILDGKTLPVKIVDGVDALTLIYQDGYRVWYAYQDVLYSYDPLTPSEVAEYSLPEPALSLGWNGVLNIATQTKLYLLKNDTMTLYDGIQGEFSVGMHDGVSYIKTADGITMYKDKEEIISLTCSDFESFASDYKGNIWTLNGDLITAYVRRLDGFDSLEYYLLPIVKDLTLLKEGRAFAIFADTIVELSLPVADVKEETTFKGETYTQDYKMMKLTKCWAYQVPDNYESITEIKEGTVSVAFEKIEYQGVQYYLGEILRDGKYDKVYVKADNVEFLQSVDGDGKYVKYAGLDREPKGYAYPSKSAESVVDIPKNTPLEVLSEVGDGEDIWYQIVVDDKKVYVEKNNNYVLDVKPYEEIKRYYAKVALSRLGESIKVYSEPSFDSEVLDYFIDGTKVEMPEELNAEQEFTKIRYNDSYAYVQTEYLIEKGLTGVQRFVLIFGSIAFVLACLPVMIFAILRRKFL